MDISEIKNLYNNKIKPALIKTDNYLSQILLKTNKLLPYLSFLSILVVFIPKSHQIFAQIARILLIIIMFSRPLRDLLLKIKILSFIVAIRKPLGILCWIFALAHWIGYLILSKISIQELFTTTNFWLPTTVIWSGLIAAILMLPPLLTSNNYSIRKLGINRKRIQKISYILFPMVAIHIALVENKITPIFLIIIYLIIYFLAYKKWARNKIK